MKEWKETIKYSIGEEEVIEVLDFEYMDEITEVPRTAGVYVFFAGHEKLYIGETANLRRRIQQHLGGTPASEKFKTEWTHLLYVALPDSSLRKFVESLLIKTHDPKYNTTDMKRLLERYEDEETVYDLVYYARVARLDFDYIAEEFGITMSTARNFSSGIVAPTIVLPKGYSPRKKLDMTKKRSEVSLLSKRKFYEIRKYLEKADMTLTSIARIFDVNLEVVRNVRDLKHKKYKRWNQERLEELATVS